MAFREEVFREEVIRVLPFAVEKVRKVAATFAPRRVLTVRVELTVTLPLRVSPFVMVTVGASRVIEVAAVAVMVSRD